MTSAAQPRQVRGRWKRYVLAAALLACAVALVNPRLTLPTRHYTLLLVFDITQSMNVRDVSLADKSGTRPTRLAFARSAALEGLRELPCGTEVGIALFTGHRSFVLFVPAEVCSHFGDMAKVIASIDWRMAWAAKSEVAKGLHSGLRTAKLIGPDVAVVFITDGHEAPPVSAEIPPRYNGEPGDVRGLVIGIGGDTAVPIPKLDPDGKAAGVFGADEVMQIDVFSAGRDASVGNETMAGASQAANPPAGTEHLSSLRAAYLEQLSGGLGLGYRTAGTTDAFSEAMRAPRLAREVREPVATGWVFALLALALLAAAHWPAGTRGS